MIYVRWSLSCLACLFFLDACTPSRPGNWRDHGIRIVRSDELDLNTPQTTGMTRAVAITCVAISIYIVCRSADAQTSATPETRVASIDLPFVADHVAISSDGRRAIVWDALSSQTDPQSLAIVDLQRQVLVAHTFLRRPLVDAVVGENLPPALRRELLHRPPLLTPPRPACYVRPRSKSRWKVMRRGA